MAASLVYWRQYGTKETVKADFCSLSLTLFFFFFINLFHVREDKKETFVTLILFAGRIQTTQSLRQVVETHRHTDVAGKADVDAEVDQPLKAGA